MEIVPQFFPESRFHGGVHRALFGREDAVDPAARFNNGDAEIVAGAAEGVPEIADHVMDDSVHFLELGGAEAELSIEFAFGDLGPGVELKAFADGFADDLSGDDRAEDPSGDENDEERNSPADSWTDVHGSSEPWIIRDARTIGGAGLGPDSEVNHAKAPARRTTEASAVTSRRDGSGKTSS